jgi:hypothetical protein
VKKFLPFIVIAALVFFSSQIQAQESEIPAESSSEIRGEAAAETPAVDDSQTVYVIRNMDFDVDGRSRPFALIYNGELKEGERIQGKAELEKYIADKTQLLINERVIEEVYIDYTLGSPEDDGAVPVSLLVHVRDTWNVIALPYPKYDSNDGFSLTLKARDYNFLGTMSALRIDLGYRRYDEDVDTDGDGANDDTVAKNRFNLEIDSDTPFRAAGLDWNLNFDHIFYFTVDEPVYYQNVTGLSVELPFRTTTFTFGFNQYLVFNEEVSDENKDLYGLDDQLNGPYGGSEVFTSWKIPVGVKIGNFGDLNYTPRVSGRINYRPGGMADPWKPVASLSHSLGFGRVDWIGNYRKGIEASVGNGYSYYIDRSDAPWAINVNAGGTVHWPFSKLIGVSARLQYRQRWQPSDRADGDDIPYYGAGDVLRGVVNNKLRANYMLSLNLDIPFRLVRFYPSEWFNYEPLHLFDFEMHISPFVDMALAEGPYYDYNSSGLSEDGISFSLDDMIMTGGFEIIVFPAYFRSLYLRASVGYNISYLKDKNKTPDLKWGVFPQWHEIYIGIGHHY